VLYVKTAIHRRLRAMIFAACVIARACRPRAMTSTAQAR
jgi:hypothetical protein